MGRWGDRFAHFNVYMLALLILKPIASTILAIGGYNMLLTELETARTVHYYFFLMNFNLYRDSLRNEVIF